MGVIVFSLPTAHRLCEMHFLNKKDAYLCHMKMNIPNVLLFLLLLLSLASCQETREYIVGEHQRVKYGDEMEWSAIEFVDTTWRIWPDTFVPNEILWVRLPVEFEAVTQEEPLGLRIVAIGKYQAYWDGQYIGENGDWEKQGGKADYVKCYLVPDSLMKEGKHVLALRTKINRESDAYNHHAYAYTGKYDDLITQPLHISKYMFLIGGIYIAVALYFMILFFTSSFRDFHAFTSSIICFVFLGLVMMEYLKLFYPYHYSFQRTRLEYIGYLHVGLSLLVPSFFLFQFNFPWKKLFFGILVSVIIFFEYKEYEHFDSLAIVENTIMWGFSFIAVAYGCINRKQEAFIVLFGFLLSFIVFRVARYFPVPFVSGFDVAVFISFSIIVISMLYISAYRQRQERKNYEASLVHSERLKNELLRKNLRPHFIMNTLTSLIDWVEDSPAEGAKFIHSLADEFAVLNEVADHKLVPIGQELKLCQSHLEVMGYRKEIAYVWSDEGIDLNEIIPPAIIHTLVENGVKYNSPNEAGKILFHLKFEKQKKRKSYSLYVEGGEMLKNNNGTGTGTKYIQSRLKESYKENWAMESHAHKNGWLTIVTIKQ